MKKLKILTLIITIVLSIIAMGVGVMMSSLLDPKLTTAVAYEPVGLNANMAVDATGINVEVTAELVGAKGNTLNDNLISSAELGTVDANGNVFKTITTYTTAQGSQPVIAQWNIGNIFFNNTVLAPIIFKVSITNFTVDKNIEIKIVEVDEAGVPLPISVLNEIATMSKIDATANQATSNGTAVTPSASATAMFSYTKKNLSNGGSCLTPVRLKAVLRSYKPKVPNEIVEVRETHVGDDIVLPYEYNINNVPYLLTWYMDHECTKPVPYNYTEIKKSNLYGRTSRYPLFVPTTYEEQNIFGGKFSSIDMTAEESEHEQLRKRALISSNAVAGNLAQNATKFATNPDAVASVGKLVFTFRPNSPNEKGSNVWLLQVGVEQGRINYSLPPFFPFDGKLCEVKGFASGSIACFKQNVFTDVEFPITMTEIGKSAFSGDSTINLTSLPNYITLIGDSAFQRCTNLALTSLPTSLETIGEFAFQGCSNLAINTFPQNLNSILFGAFDSCNSINFFNGGILLPINLQKLGSYAFPIGKWKRTNANNVNSLYYLADLDGKSWIVGAVNYNISTALWTDTSVSGVKGIAGEAFFYCSSLSVTTLPDGIIRIGDFAFNGCTNLALTSLPNSLTSIGDSAFNNCSHLALTTFPQNLKMISVNAFNGCTSAGFVPVLPQLLEEIYANSFPLAKQHKSNGTAIDSLNYLTDINGKHWILGVNSVAQITVPYWPENSSINVKSIISGVFKDCTNLGNIVLPQMLTKIAKNTFNGCTNLNITALPANVTEIDSYAFKNCTSLNITALPENIVSIGVQAFYHCSNIRLTSLPFNLTVIEAEVFRGCSNLALTSLPSKLVGIERSAFEGCTLMPLTSLPSTITSLGSLAFKDCTSLALTTLPPSLVTIKMRTFMNCTSLAIASLPFYVTTIENESFMGCTSLAISALPELLSSIGSKAFSGCTKISSISVQSNIKAIANNAFENCTLLAEFVINSNPPPIIGTNVFLNCKMQFAIKVPILLKDIYGSAQGWAEYISKLVGIN
ncbi:MAG: leucine-rich repeat domain-containing protein [Clostridia bacterium]